LYSYLADRAPRVSRKNIASLIPVKLTDDPERRNSSTIELDLPGAVTLRVPVDISPVRLAELIVAVRDHV
ncbi:MAG: hypothetical protein ACKVX7_01720, partial [Planctomycetota bacterium]